MELLLPPTREISPRAESLRAVNQRGAVKNNLLLIFPLGCVRRPILELLVSDRVQSSTLIVGWLIHEQPGCLRRRPWLHLVVKWVFPLHVILIELVCVDICLLLGSDPPYKVWCGIT
jgi:hypothetical protein